MATSITEMQKAFLEAGADLKINVLINTRLYASSQILVCPIFLPQFGSAKGTAVFPKHWMQQNDYDVLRKSNYFVSLLYDSYDQYERQNMIDTLNDWGYYGKNEEKPDWYTGRAWS